MGDMFRPRLGHHQALIYLVFKHIGMDTVTFKFTLFLQSNINL